MSENTEKPKSSSTSDEIDLKELFKSIGNFFISIYTFFISLILGFRKITLGSYKLISVTVFLSIAIGIGLKYQSKPFYESEMVIRSPYLNIGISNTIFDKLNSLCEEQNYEALASVLGIKVEDATKLRGISASPFLSEQEIIDFEIFKERISNLVKDESDVEQIVNRLQYQNRSMYKISVQVFDPSVIIKLEKPLVDYLKNSDYLKKRIEISQQNRIAKKEKLENELLKLDTLRDVVQKSMIANIERRDRGSNNIFMGGETSGATNPLEVVRENIRRFDDLLILNRDIFLESDFEVIDTFISFEKPAGMRFSGVILYSLLIGLLIAYGIIFLKVFNSYLDRMENEVETEV